MLLLDALREQILDLAHVIVFCHFVTIAKICDPLNQMLTLLSVDNILKHDIEREG